MREYLKEAAPKPPESNEAVRRTVTEIIAAVRQEGDTAVRRFSERLDAWSPPSFKLSPAEIERGIARVSDEDRKTIDYCRDQIATFARRQRESIGEFEVEQQDGVILGQRLIPVDSVGAYVPGGRYPLVASALMSVTTARVAGVRRVIACSPPSPVGVHDGERGIYPATLYAMVAAGADEVFCLGGVQAMAALSYGTESIPAAHMVVGPGNQYVAEAKRPDLRIGRHRSPGGPDRDPDRRRRARRPDRGGMRPPGPGRARTDVASHPGHDVPGAGRGGDARGRAPASHARDAGGCAPGVGGERRGDPRGE
jgi:sulfopropanediol 3-dehydrogenase